MARLHQSPFVLLLVATALTGCERDSTESVGLELETSVAPFSAPSPNSPKDGAMITTGFRARLGWKLVPDATRYQVEVWSNDASGPFTRDLLADTTSFVLDSLNRATYYWHVRGLSPASLTGPWSTIRRFTILGRQ